MPRRGTAIHLGGTDLGRRRHICALFQGPSDAARVLVPFVLDGLRAGERVVHVVEARGPYLDRLANAVDVESAVSSGQLDVRTWDESYLGGGSFSATRMLAYIRRLVREGVASGFPATRLIGDMDWAATGVPGADQLVAYEAGLATILARPSLAVVCAYDARRLDPGQADAILAAHEATFVDDRLEPAPGRVAASPRDRILAAAALLFSEDGPSRTGIDAVIEAAGVAKATFYRYFPAKDDLIVAWLRDGRTRWFDRLRVTVEARARTPQEVVPRLFEAVAEWLEAEDYLGCPYLNTAPEFSHPDHPASVAIRAYLAEIGAYLAERVAAAGYPEPARLGRELHVLLAGSITLGAANRTTAHLLTARDAAVALLGATSSRGRHRRPAPGR